MSTPRLRASRCWGLRTNGGVPTWIALAVEISEEYLPATGLWAAWVFIEWDNGSAVDVCVRRESLVLPSIPPGEGRGRLVIYCRPS